MKNAFDVNLPKPSTKSKSPVATLASSLSTAPVEAAEPEPRARPKLRRPAAPVVPLQARPPEQSGNESSSARIAILDEVQGHLDRAIKGRGLGRSQIHQARSVLSRTAGAASEALHQLAMTERQLDERRLQLTSLLEEIDALEGARSRALDMAQRLSDFDRAYAQPSERSGSGRRPFSAPPHVSPEDDWRC
jgi:hypothetical protein